MRRATLVVALGVLVLTSAAGAQQEQMQMAHDHGAMEMDANGELSWRMPPMDPNMPMMPGLMGALPAVGPILPGFGLDPMDYPEARPREVMDLVDGQEITLTASVVRRMIAGRQYLVFAYNQQYPGPLLRAPTGATVVVNFENEIDQATTVHWHGLRLDNRFDGVPGVTQAPVLPGESFRYEVLFADTGVYWYHPHMREDIQQDLGLYGNLLAVPTQPDYYAEVNREEFLILDDMLIDDAGIVPYGDAAPTHTLMGRFGNVMLTNGATDYRLDVDRGEVVRFYVTNVANARTFNVTFGGAPIKVVASDLSKYEHEVWVDSVPIAPAERYVIEVRFDESGTVPIENTIQAIDHFRGEFYPHVDHLGNVSVADSMTDRDLADGFATLRSNLDVAADVDSYRAHFDRAPDHEIELTLEIGDLPLPIIQSMEFEKGLYVPPVEWNDTMPMMNWLSTGEEVRWILRDRASGRENMDIRWEFKKGDIVKLRVFNNPETLHPMHHPIHVHGQRYLVTSVDGVPNSNLVWKDTAIVPVASTVDMLIEMTNPGEWMVHCHIAEHLHSGMMLSFSVE
ncbi:MAG: multicopper oxidase domain-containing protein [Acidobacteria bacterium]|nr:multicopper oxidase domain-containing protein [Acidobacteriota bacterium]